MIRVVLDTNLIVSAHLNEAGMEASVFKLALAKKIEWFVSKQILEEYDVVLRRKKLNLEPGLIRQSLGLINKAVQLVEPGQRLSISPDEADNRFLECAEVARADYLVTGNKRHFPKRWKSTSVVNAREFLEIIALDLRR